jgi:hypothetical protein
MALQGPLVQSALLALLALMKSQTEIFVRSMKNQGVVN